MTSVLVPIRIYTGDDNKPASCPYVQPVIDPTSACGRLFGLWMQNCRVGPVRANSGSIKTWYGVFVDPKNKHKILVWKTDDWGENWEIQDGEDFPRLTNEIGSFDFQTDSSGNLIIVTQEYTTGRVSYYIFNTSTDTFSLINEVVVSSVTLLSNNPSVSVAQKTNGDILVGYHTNKETIAAVDLQRIAVKRRLGVASWSSEIHIGHWGGGGTGFGGQNQSDNLERIVPLLNNRFAVWFTAAPGRDINSATDRYLHNVNSSNVAGTIVRYRGGAVSTVTWNIGDYSTYDSGGYRYVLIPFGQEGNQEIYYWIDDGASELGSAAGSEILGNSGIPSGGNNGFIFTSQVGIRAVNGVYRHAYVVRGVGYTNPQVDYRSGVLNSWTPDDGSVVGYQVGAKLGGSNLGFNAVSKGAKIWVTSFNDGLSNNDVMFNLLNEASLPSSPSLDTTAWNAVCVKTDPWIIQKKIINGGVISFDSNVTKGNLIIVGTGYYHGAAIPTISDTLGTSYTRLQQDFFDSTHCVAFYGFAPASGADTITVVAAGASDWLTAVHEIQKIASFDTYVGTSYDSSSSPQNSDSLTTASASEFLFGLIAGWRNATIFDVDSSIDTQLTFAHGADAIETQYRIQKHASTTSMDFSQSNNDHGGILVLAFKTT